MTDQPPPPPPPEVSAENPENVSAVSAVTTTSDNLDSQVELTEPDDDNIVKEEVLSGWEKPDTKLTDAVTRGMSEEILLGGAILSKEEKKNTDPEKKLLVSEILTTTTLDPRDQHVVSKRIRRNKPLKLEQFASTLRREATLNEHTEMSFKKVYNEYLRRQFEIKGRPQTALSFKERFRDYFVTSEMVERSPDMEYRLKISLAELVTFAMFVIILSFGKEIEKYLSLGQNMKTH